MLTEQIQSFAKLGRVWRQLQSINFAESINIDNSEVLTEVQTELEKETGDLTRLFNVTLDDNDVFRGNAEQRISIGRSQTFEFEIGDRMRYRLVDAPEFADTDEEWIEILEYAARSGKKLNCKPGNIQCGGKCQGGSKNCFVDMSSEQRKAIKSAAGKARSGKPESEAKPKPDASPKRRRDGKHNDISEDLSNKRKVEAMAKLSGLSQEDSQKAFDSIKRFVGKSYTEIRNSERGIAAGQGKADVTRRQKAEQDAENINRYLRTAPAFDGEVYRGVSFNSKEDRDGFISSISNGYSLEAMSSFSSNRRIATDFAEGNSTQASYGIVFRVRNRSGVSIRGISTLPEEDEVLVPRGARYRPAQYRKSGNNIFIDLVEEDSDE